MAIKTVSARLMTVFIAALFIICTGAGCQSQTNAGPKDSGKAGDTPKDGEAKADDQPKLDDANQDKPKDSNDENGDNDNPKFAFQEFPVPEHFTRLAKDQDVWFDKKTRSVVVDGEICLREGLLELLICEEGGKTHESVIKVKGKPSTVHTLLELAGAKKGTPVKFQPEHQPATGSEIDITVKYVDTKGKMHSVPGQRFVRNKKTNKALKHPWVFAGSFFFKDEFIKRELYMADEAGEFVCVVNFPSATLDLPIPSDQANQNLMFEAFTENIPLVGTKVRVTLKPKPEKKGEVKSDAPKAK
jgi:hypothetical protein